MSDENHSSSDIPTPDDGFHRPAEEVRRRNLITAGIILAILGVWVLYGLRKPLFGWLFG